MICSNSLYSLIGMSETNNNKHNINKCRSFFVGEFAWRRQLVIVWFQKGLKLTISELKKKTWINDYKMFT